MADEALEAPFRRRVAEQLRSATPQHEILTELMSNGFTEAEARDFLARVLREAPPPPDAGTTPRRTDAAAGLLAMSTGVVVILAGAGVYVATGQFSLWFLIAGVVVIAGGLARIATGGS